MTRRWKTNVKTNRLIPSEHAEQSALIEWTALAQGNIPELGLLFAIPNGGRRHPAVAMAMKREGVKRGVPDLMLPVARCGLHGLFLEMKAADGRLSPEQKRWRDMLIAQGYGVAVAFSFEDAKTVLEDYLSDKWRLENGRLNDTPLADFGDSGRTGSSDVPEPSRKPRRRNRK
jgi:hypothetical protein